jgi:hypothetical protein
MGRETEGTVGSLVIVVVFNYVPEEFAAWVVVGQVLGQSAGLVYGGIGQDDQIGELSFAQIPVSVRSDYGLKAHHLFGGSRPTTLLWP